MLKAVFIFVGERKKQYGRRGTTYDKNSVNSADVVPTPNAAESSFPSGLQTFGRGRGRGRPSPTQPLRRPVMPGIAGAGGELPALHTEDESPWSGTLGAGRGVRPPTTAPIGWAGRASAPDPSSAPLPPTAWQQGSVPTNPSKPFMQTSMNVSTGMSSAGIACLGWPALAATSSRAGKNLHNAFESFSLFDKDDYD